MSAPTLPGPSPDCCSSTITRSCATACGCGSKRPTCPWSAKPQRRRTLALAASLEPDLALMDVGMNGMNGITLAGVFHERFPGIRVLMLSMHDNIEYVTQAVRAGASGYLLKDSPASEIVRAIGTVLAGQTFFSETAARMIHASATASPLDRLTPREATSSTRWRKGCPASRSRSDRAVGAHGRDAPAQSEAQAGDRRAGRADQVRGRASAEVGQHVNGVHLTIRRPISYSFNRPLPGSMESFRLPERASCSCFA